VLRLSTPKHLEKTVQRQIFRSVLIIAGATFWLAGCTATSSQRSAGETIDDGVLTTRVKTALIGDARTKARKIDVETFRGEVQLNGFVDSAAEKTAATSVARSVKGVTTVKNNLQIGGDRTAGQVVDDVTITAKVRTALIEDPRTKSHQIEVTTNSGVVQLAGFVDNATNKTVAEQLANRVAGVTRVTNKLEVRSN
jgi:hyperosmotically inducible protein